MRHATAYQRHDGYYIHSESQTTSGVWVAAKPFKKLPSNVSPEELGATVEEALAASQVGIAHPVNWDAVEYPLPSLAGVKSWATFMKNAKCVNVKDENGCVEVRPSKNIGPAEGYEPLACGAIIMESATLKSLGVALLDAFAISK